MIGGAVDWSFLRREVTVELVDRLIDRLGFLERFGRVASQRLAGTVD